MRKDEFPIIDKFVNSEINKVLDEICEECKYFNTELEECGAFECYGLDCPSLPCEVMENDTNTQGEGLYRSAEGRRADDL